MPEVTVTYYDKSGPDNTEATLRIAKKRAEELGIHTIVVASTKGKTGVRATEVFKGEKVVVVSHTAGFDQPNTQQLTEENRKRILANGGIIHTASHAFTGVGGAVRRKFNTYGADDIVANTLRVFGAGTKVACEIVLMAADGGLVRTDEDVIAIAGSSEGADTALVLQPVNLRDLFDLKVREVLCKPRVW
ncbi:MAG: pyruvate kinase alpha/beta domain-containing protein [Chloroflexota bacterium]|nr:pyruvate kinase alpha/beta domain-containing protein [Chloroflexota bacterium]